jgi:hypothetical protein
MYLLAWFITKLLTLLINPIACSCGVYKNMGLWEVELIANPILVKLVAKIVTKHKDYAWIF